MAKNTEAKKKRIAEMWEREHKKLEDFLYENDLYEKAVQLSPYHFRIIGKVTIDIWAGRRKYFIKGMSNSAQYQNLEELKKYL